MWTTSRATPAVPVAVAFGTLSPSDIRKMSMQEVTATTLVKRREPVANGPNSPFFGTEDRNMKCSTCNGEPLGKTSCEGHFGHIELAVPVYKPDWIHINYLVRKCICYACRHELFDRNIITMKQIERTTSNYMRLQAVAVAMENKTKLMCGKPGTVFNFRDVTEKGMPCGAVQPKWRHVGMRIIPDFDNVPMDEYSGTRPAFTSKVDWQGQVQISKRTARFLGFKTRLSHPGNLIITVLPVPPICIRPSTEIHQHDFTTQLLMISKLNVAMKAVQRANARWYAIRGPLSDLEKHQLRIDTERFYNSAVIKYQTVTGASPSSGSGLGGSGGVGGSGGSAGGNTGYSGASGSGGGAAANSVPANGPHISQQLQHGGANGRPGAGGKAGAYSRRASSLNGLRKSLEVINTILEQAAETKEAALAAASAVLSRQVLAGDSGRNSSSSSTAEITTAVLWAYVAATTTTGTVGGGPFDDATGTLKQVGLVLAEYAAEVHMELQYAVWTYFDNGVNGIRPDLQKNGQPYSFLLQRYQGKNNRIRWNIMGKRVNWGARSVITPSPHLAVDEVNYPKAFAAVQIDPRMVTPLTRASLTAALIENRISQITLPDGTPLDMHTMPNPAALVLQDNWVAECHQDEGAPAMINRQPSLHRMSIMAHRMRMHDKPNFKLSMAATTPYNADFDGDEINLHTPMSKLARAEAEEIAAVDKHTLNPKDGSATMFLVQDAVLGSYLLAHKDRFFTHCQLKKLLTALRFTKQEPAWTVFRRSRKTGKRVFRWTGCALWSVAFPVDSTINAWGYDGHGDTGLLSHYKLPKSMERADWKKIEHSGLRQLRMWEDIGLVRNSKLLCGRVTKGNAKPFVRTLTKQMDGQAACNWMTDVQLLTNDFIAEVGCTISLDDVHHNYEGMKRKLVERVLQWSRQFTNVVAYSREEADLVEVCRHLQAILGEQHQKSSNVVLPAEPKTAPHLPPTPPSFFPVRVRRDGFAENTTSGAKGDKFNRTQVSVMLGQQLLGGNRPRHPLPQFHPELEDNLEAHGFVSRGLWQGLRAHQYFDHTRSSRETLTDTSNKTPDCGYITRRLVKLMESLQICADGSVRDAAGNLYMPRYGTDGYDGTYVEVVKLRTVMLDDKQLFERYHGRSVPLNSMTEEAQCRHLQGQGQGQESEGREDALWLEQEYQLVKSQRNAYRALHLRLSTEKLPDEVRCVVPFARLVTDVLTRRGARASDYQVDSTPGEFTRLLHEFEEHLEQEKLLVQPLEIQTGLVVPPPVGMQEEEEEEKKVRVKMEDSDSSANAFADASAGDSDSKEAEMREGAEQLKQLQERNAEQNAREWRRLVLARNTQYFRILLHDWLSPAHAVAVYRLNLAEYKALMLDVEAQLGAGMVPLGEMVGPLAAQSIGEPSTQMTLNTFHYAGADNVLGIPRLKEIISAVAADKLQRPTMTVYLAAKRRGYLLRDPAGAAQALAASLPAAAFGDLVERWDVVHVGTLQDVHSQLDGWFTATQERLLSDSQRGFLSRFAMRFVLDKTACAKRGLTPADIAAIVHPRAFAEPVHHWTYSPAAATEWVLRLRLNTRSKKYTQLAQAAETMRPKHQQGPSATGIELIWQLKNLARRMMMFVHVHGLKGVQRASATQVTHMQVDEATGAVVEQKEWVVKTVGAEYEGVMRHPWVDFNRTTTNDIIGTASVLGIEAATRAISDEILSIMKAHGIDVDARHTSIIAEVMNHVGVVLAMTRFGAIHNTPSLVLHSSFEETGSCLSKGAAFGQFDAMAGPSERLMIGCEVHMGTGTVRLSPAVVSPANQLDAERHWADFQFQQRGVRLPPETVHVSSLAPFRAPINSRVVVSSMYDVLLAKVGVDLTSVLMQQSGGGGAGDSAGQRIATPESLWGMTIQGLHQALEVRRRRAPVGSAGAAVASADSAAAALAAADNINFDLEKRQQGNNSEAATTGLLGVLHKCPTCKINDCMGRQCRRCHQEMRLMQYTTGPQQHHQRQQRRSRLPDTAQAISLSSVPTGFLMPITSGAALTATLGDNGRPRQQQQQQQQQAAMLFEEALPDEALPDEAQAPVFLAAEPFSMQQQASAANPNHYEWEEEDEENEDAAQQTEEAYNPRSPDYGPFDRPLTPEPLPEHADDIKDERLTKAQRL